jgi:hypothetical protein
MAAGPTRKRHASMLALDFRRFSDRWLYLWVAGFCCTLTCRFWSAYQELRMYVPNSRVRVTSADMATTPVREFQARSGHSAVNVSFHGAKKRRKAYAPLFHEVDEPTAAELQDAVINGVGELAGDKSRGLFNASRSRCPCLFTSSSNAR